MKNNQNTILLNSIEDSAKDLENNKKSNLL